MSINYNSELILRSIIREVNNRGHKYEISIQEFPKVLGCLEDTKRVVGMISKDGQPLFVVRREIKSPRGIHMLRGSVVKKLLKLILISGLLTQAGLKEDE
jgi:hypothetical protein